MTSSAISATDYEYLRKFLKKRSGIDLSLEKQYLAESRLAPIAREAGCNDLAGLFQQIRKGSNTLSDALIEAMTTNETSFFRDKSFFQQFRENIIPTLIRNRSDRRTLRIWCAASATGQEPYSVAIALKETPAIEKNWRIEIIATDLSQQVLVKAVSGRYSQFEIQRGLPIQLLLKYFGKNGDLWEINPEVRKMVRFRPLNLLSVFSHLGRFDVILCRNVLIYFDQTTKADILRRLGHNLEKDGFLALGSAETIMGSEAAFTRCSVSGGFYQPRNNVPVQ